jgi:hypothetical protein
MNRTVIGIDCSTGARKVGIARAIEASHGWDILNVTACSADRRPVDVVAEWIDAAPGKVLLALDAPLGWPIALGRSLVDHRAGAVIDVPANKLFRRATDEFVRQELSKQSLDVGADRIARTAHWTLAFLGELRQAAGERIPLAWTPTPEERVTAIEVYPAASLKARGIATGSYKKSAAIEDRRSIVARLGADLRIPGDNPFALGDDEVDALVCVLAGVDFLAGRAAPPPDMALAQSEGWIWVALPGQGR